VTPFKPIALSLSSKTWRKSTLNRTVTRLDRAR
jgi:hypothetical protein